MLLYLNDTTFCDRGATAGLVREAQDAGITMVLVQEMNPTRGACAFGRFFEVTPDDLLKQRRLFDTLAAAVPWRGAPRRQHPVHRPSHGRERAAVLEG